MTGIIRSSRIKDGSGLLFSQSMAARPLTACTVLRPEPSSVVLTRSRTSGSSSTISTDGLAIFAVNARTKVSNRARSIGLVMNSEAPSV